jgi:hypothetical protein
MIQYLIQHPVVILYLAAGWFVAAIISAMPQYKGSNFWIVWLVNVAQIIGASLDKVGHAAQQSTAFKQVQSTLETSGVDGLKKVETATTTTQTATPVIAAIPPPGATV